MKICLDAGHYGNYNRSRVVREYYEGEMTWKLHNYLAEELERYGVVIVKTRADQEKDLGLEARGEASIGCDLFLSIHSNAVDEESVDHPLVLTMLDGKGDELGLKLAKKIEEVMGTRETGRIRHKEGSKPGKEWYSVLYGAASVGTMGMIIEHSFHSNEKAARWLLEDANLRKLAKAEAEVLAEHYNLYPIQDSIYYEVTSGPYATEAEAKAVADKLVAQGYYGVGYAKREPQEVEKPKEWVPAVGDVVRFTGCKQYSSSTSDSPRGAVAGIARITAMASGKKHPYHLERTGDTGPWGWVDAGTFTKA